MVTSMPPHSDGIDRRQADRAPAGQQDERGRSAARRRNRPRRGRGAALRATAARPRRSPASRRRRRPASAAGSDRSRRRNRTSARRRTPSRRRSSRCCTTSRQASRSLPVHTASMNRNLTSRGSTQASSSAIRMVSAILNGVENRFARSQPTAPVIAAGGGRASMVAARDEFDFGDGEIAFGHGHGGALTVPPARCGCCTSSSAARSRG